MKMTRRIHGFCHLHQRIIEPDDLFAVGTVFTRFIADRPNDDARMRTVSGDHTLQRFAGGIIDFFHISAGSTVCDADVILIIGAKRDLNEKKDPQTVGRL